MKLGGASEASRVHHADLGFRARVLEFFFCLGGGGGAGGKPYFRGLGFIARNPQAPKPLNP